MLSNNLFAADSSFAFTVTPECLHTDRIDRYLASRFPLYSRSFFSQLLLERAVVVNGNVVIKASTAVHVGDEVVLTFPAKAEPPTAIEIGQYTVQIKMVYEHPHFLIINKPAGILVHSPNYGSVEPTVVDWVALHYKDSEHTGSVDRPGIVHRLDRETSGLMIIARTQYAFKAFASLFEQRCMAKTYLAVVHGHPPQSGTVEFGIGRHPVHRHKMMAHTPAIHRNRQHTGMIRHAITNYEVLKYFNEYSLVAAKPVTGRTHQIRVHLSAIGHPLVGDPMYGSRSPLITRHALHAHTLAFTFDGQLFTFTANVPDDFNELVEKIGGAHLINAEQ